MQRLPTRALNQTVFRQFGALSSSLLAYRFASTNEYNKTTSTTTTTSSTTKPKYNDTPNGNNNSSNNTDTNYNTDSTYKSANTNASGNGNTRTTYTSTWNKDTTRNTGWSLWQTLTSPLMLMLFALCAVLYAASHYGWIRSKPRQLDSKIHRSEVQINEDASRKYGTGYTKL